MSARGDDAEWTGAFVRFVVPDVVHEASQVPTGVIAFAYDLVAAPDTSERTRADLKRSLRWFEDVLEVPDRFNRTSSKGWYRRNTRGISWLRSSASEHIAAMQRLAEIISGCGHRVAEVRTERVGYVIYQDAVQVVAEPFRDTRTK